MIVFLYCCYILAALDIWTTVACAIKGERLTAVLGAILTVMCLLAARVLQTGGWV